MGKRWTMTVGLFVAAVMVLSAGVAQAGWLPYFTGHTEFTHDTTGTVVAKADSDVSFAVYKTEDADWTDDKALGAYGVGQGNIGTIISGLDVSPLDPDSVVKDAKYVYFYQVVNTNRNGQSTDAPVTEFHVVVGKKENVSSRGQISGYVFNENAGNVNAEVGTVGNPNLTATPADPTPELLNHEPTTRGYVFDTDTGSPDTLFNPFILGSTGPVDANHYAMTEDDDQDILRFNFPTASTTGDIAADGTSSVVFFTSDNDPGYWTGATHDIIPAYGDVPTIPEPMPLIALLSGLPLVGFGWLRWRRKK